MLTLVAFGAVCLVRWAYGLLGASRFEAAVAGEGVRQGIERGYPGKMVTLPAGATITPPQGGSGTAPPTGWMGAAASAGAGTSAGHDLIQARMRRREIDQEMAAADEAKVDLAERQVKLWQDRDLLAGLIHAAGGRLEKAKAELAAAEDDHRRLSDQQKENAGKRSAIDTKLRDLSVATVELEKEKAALV